MTNGSMNWYMAVRSLVFVVLARETWCQGCRRMFGLRIRQAGQSCALLPVELEVYQIRADSVSNRPGALAIRDHLRTRCRGHQGYLGQALLDGRLSMPRSYRLQDQASIRSAVPS